MISHTDFPRLTASNHRVTSPASTDYNCIAWSANDTEHWWQPDVYWPIPWPGEDWGIGALERAFVALGFESCADGSLDPGFEKVALYGSILLYTHAARQLPNGKWTSKLGRAEDIEHNAPEDVGGGLYGEVMGYMRRPMTSTA